MLLQISTGSLRAVPGLRADGPEQVQEWFEPGAWQYVGTDETGERELRELDLVRPTVLVLGNETRGMSSAWWEACDTTVALPIVGSASSLNVAVTGSIVLHELAHGWAALRLGDTTSRDTGHMTWNPLVRMGPFSLAAFAIIGIGAAGFLLRERLFGGPEPDDAGTPPIDAGQDAGPLDAGPRTPTEHTHIVHFQRRVRDAALALGPPDGRYAVIQPQGTIVLEIAAGTRIATDGTSQPDVWIVIDDARSDPYRADVGVARNQYTTVGSELVGTLGLDADQFEISRIRYVRIKNRGRRNLYLDSVGAFSTVEADD